MKKETPITRNLCGCHGARNVIDHCASGKYSTYNTGQEYGAVMQWHASTLIHNVQSANLNRDGYHL